MGRQGFASVFLLEGCPVNDFKEEQRNLRYAVKEEVL